MRPYADTINRLPDPATLALYDALAAKVAIKKGYDFAQVREYGAPGGGPNKQDFRREASFILDLLTTTELTLPEITEVLAQHGIAV